MGHNSKSTPLIEKLLFLSFFFGSAGLYMSISFIGLSHILLFIPILFLVKKENLTDLLQSKTAQFLIGFIILGSLSVIFNWNEIKAYESPWKLLFKLKYFIIALLSVPCFSFYIKSRRQNPKSSLTFLLRFLLIASTLATCSGLIGLYTGFNPLTFKNACNPTRNCGMSGMLMTYAYSISIFCSILFGWIINFKKNDFISKKYLIIIFLINFIGLYFTYSRGALLGFILSIPLCFFWKNKAIFKGGLVLAFILTILGGSFLFNKVKNAKTTPKDQYLDTLDNGLYRLKVYPESELTRLSLVYAAIHIFKENPILGVGYRNFSNVAPSYKKKYDLNKISKISGHAHNNYFEVLSGMGILGMIAYLGFIFSWIWTCLKGTNIYLKMLLPGLINFSISGFFQSTLIDGEITFFLMIIFAITIVSQQLEGNKNQEEAVTL